MAKIKIIQIKNFIIESKTIHGNKINYDKILQDVNSEHGITTKVLLECNSCGYIFSQQINSNLSGRGCNECANTVKRGTKEKFIKRALQLHEVGRYSYEDVEYKNNSTKVLVFCNKCNTTFPIAPNNHTNSTRPRGCPCNKTRGKHTEKTYKGRRTLLYYIKVEGLYKIGITLESIKKRYAMEYRDGYKIEVINKVWYEDGIDALKKEQEIIEQYKLLKYKGPKIFIHGGDSELFTEDILNLDTTTEDKALILF